MKILPLAAEPFTCPTDRDMLPSERRSFVRTHRTCVFGTARRADGPAMSIVYYVPTDDDELLVSTMRDRGKAKAVGRNEKVSLCVLDERWPFSYLQVYCDAAVDEDADLVVDVIVIRVVHVDEGAQHLATRFGDRLVGRWDEHWTGRVAEVLVVALDVEDIGVPRDRPERPIALRLHPDDRVLAAQDATGGVEALLVRVRGRVHEDSGEISQVSHAHVVLPFRTTFVQ
jgi:hypothetical protein